MMEQFGERNHYRKKSKILAKPNIAKRLKQNTEQKQIQQKEKTEQEL